MLTYSDSKNEHKLEQVSTCQTSCKKKLNKIKQPCDHLAK